MSLRTVRMRPMFFIALVAFAATLVVTSIAWARALDVPAVLGERPGPSVLDLVYDGAGGLTFAVVGFVVWWRRPRNVTGPLMVIIGGSALMWIFEYLPVPPLVTLGQLSWGAPPVLIGVLLVLYPSGKLQSWTERAWLAAAATVLVMGVLHAFTTPIGRWSCPDCHSWIVLSYDENVSNNLWLLKQNLFAVLGVALAGILIRRWVRASAPARRLMAPLWVAGVAFVLVALAMFVLDTSGFSPNIFSDVPNLGAVLQFHVPPLVWMVMPHVAAFAMLLIPLALGWGQIRSRWRQAAVSALAIRLRRADARAPLVDYLRQALGDPSLQLALWSRPAQTYVTPEGLPIGLPNAADPRAVTRLDAEDGPLAALVHDPALSEQRQLVDGVAAVAQLAIENERLHAEVKAQLEEVRASRERIVSAADEERRRVERNLHDGAQQRLVGLAMALRMAEARAAEASPDVAATLSAAEEELRQAIGELRELARGIHPAILTEAGLAPALESLAERAPLRVAVDTRLNGRLPPVTEATAYFVTAEALANVAKHAGATAASVRAKLDGTTLRISIVDNGVGGADPTRGSGIRGLMDRVAALGGSLFVDDAPGGGTRLEAEIPCPQTIQPTAPGAR